MIRLEMLSWIPVGIFSPSLILEKISYAGTASPSFQKPLDYADPHSLKGGFPIQVDSIRFLFLLHGEACIR
jgi:hypothetical protein